MSDTLKRAVTQLRAIAAQAQKTGQVAEAPPHPDAELLALCATVLDLSAKAKAIDREARRNTRGGMGDPAFAAEMKKRDAVQNERRSPMMRIPKFRAKTAAGIYAKALVLKESYGCAARLALTLAEDLERCPGLRSTLWPAQPLEDQS